MKQTKKGFTLVELLVVIAILAVLATVSVVGYTTFITKAQISADEQAVVQMNVVLQAVQTGGEQILVEDNDAQTCINIFNKLVENGYSDEFHTYYANYSIGYVVNNGMVTMVLVEDNAVVYPEKYVGSDYKTFFMPTNNTAEFLEAIKTGYALLTEDAVFPEALTISNSVTIVGNDKNLQDNLSSTKDESANSAVNITGATEDITVTISGVNIINSGDNYARGINIGANAGKVTLIIENCTINAHSYALNVTGNTSQGVDITVRNSTIEGWAALNIWSKSNITFENCTIIDYDIASDDGDNIFAPIVVNWQQNGAIGNPADSELIFNNCTIEIRDRGDDVFIIVRDQCKMTFTQCTFKIDGEEITNLNGYVINEIEYRTGSTEKDFTLTVQ